MDELIAIRHNCKEIAAGLSNNKTLAVEDAVKDLCMNIDTLTHWVIKIAEELKMK